MTNVKVVIGANYGDEGKGLMTDYFCHSLLKKNSKVLNVCSNGGAQRGHTVETCTDFKRQKHVFHHFGSGTLAGADTYLSSQYMINPIIFCQEYSELMSMGYEPMAYVSPECRITTPFDMELNRIAETKRGKDRHGSCGMGIWETINRNNTKYGFTIFDFCNAINVREKITSLLNNTKNYFSQRISELNLSISDYSEFLNNEKFFNNYIEDFCFMLNHISITPIYEILNEYNSVVIENGQGLLLDRDIGSVNTTPTHTGIYNIFDSLQDVDFSKLNVEVCYVTRSYLTRHGAGDFPTECDVKEINHNFDIRENELTNIPNEYQGAIRYGKINLKELTERIKSDISKAYNIYPESKNWIVSTAVTHLNETYGKFCNNDDNYVDDKIFDIIYKNNGRTRDSVKMMSMKY